MPDPVPRQNVYLWAGPGFHIVHYPLRHGTLFNIVAVYRTATFAGKLDRGRHRAEVARTYAGTHPAMQAMLAMMDLERRWPIADRDPIRQWHQGRVALVGDAAHPTLQSLAQGACMAIEDGVCLAALIDLADGDFRARLCAISRPSAACAPPACSSNHAICGTSIMPRASPAMSCARPSRTAPRTTCSAAWPGFMTACPVAGTPSARLRTFAREGRLMTEARGMSRS